MRVPLGALLLFAASTEGLRSRGHPSDDSDSDQPPAPTWKTGLDQNDQSLVCMTPGRRVRLKTCTKHNASAYPEQSSCPSTGITNCPGGFHGFGNLFSIFVGHYVWAKENNVSFCVTPWATMAHGQNATEMFSFMGGYSFGPPATKDTPQDFLQRTGIHRIKPEHLDEIRGFYKSTPKPSLSGGERFVWHLRRGDAMENMTDKAIIFGAATLKRMYGSRMEILHFVTEGKEEEFESIVLNCVLLRIECRVHVNDSLQKDFHRMVMADVLVQASHSTLSAAAGTLNTGDVFQDVDIARGKRKPMMLESRTAAWQTAFENVVCDEKRRQHPD